MRILILGALCALTTVSAAQADSFAASKSYPAKGVESVRIDFPAGSLKVEGTDADQIEVRMTATCRKGWRRCSERIRSVKLVTDTRGKTMVLKLEGLSKLHTLRVDLDLTVRIPQRIALDIDMGAGELDIAGVGDDVAVHMGAGEVDIRHTGDTVSSVELRVGIGDASVRRHGRSMSGSGFLSKHLRWDTGDGPARIDVDLGVGDIGVRLD